MKTLEPEQFLKQQKSLSAKSLKTSIYIAYIAGIAVIFQAYLLAYIIDGLAFKDIKPLQITPYLLALGAVFLFRYVFQLMSDNFALKAASHIQKQLRLSLREKLRKLGPVYIAQKGSAALLSGLTDGIDTISKYYQIYLPAKAMMSGVPLCILLVVFPLDWLSGLIMLITAPLIPVFMILIGKGAEKKNQAQWEKLNRMSNHFLDSIQGLSTLKMFGAVKRETKELENSSEIYRRETMGVLRIAFLSSVTLEFFSTVSIALVAVIIGFRLMWAEIDFFTGFFILLLAPEFYAPLRKMGTAYHARMESIGAADILCDIDQAKAIEPCDKTNDVPNLSKAVIKFENITCSYDHQSQKRADDIEVKQALSHINITINPNTHIALIGPSGAGKSTILSLILRFIEPESGEIHIGDVNIKDLDPVQWRHQISWISQNPTLFYGTVMDNIRMGNAAASDADILSVCKKLKIHDFISSLPKGYETEVGERGYGISGGQLQRIAIARAFLRDAPIILMDEPTASLDRETEELIQSSIDELSRGKTCITIAHRLQTIQKADQIIYMDHGSIIHNAKHEDLIKQSSEYKALIEYELQDVDMKERSK